MASLIVNGDTSGSVTLSAPAVAGTVTVTLPATSGTMLTTASSTGISGSAISSGTVAEAYGGTGTNTGYYGFKNRIINGAMVIDQRNAGASVTVSSTSALTYGVDRWFGYGNVASKFAIQQNAGAVTPPAGFSNYFGATSSSAYSVGSGDYFVLGQKIEGYNIADLGFGTANAKTITLSFQVYSSLTGTFGGAVCNGAQTRSYPFTFTVSSANTWTPITVTIAGDTGGTWVSTSAAGLNLWFGLGEGSTWTGTAGSWSSNDYRGATGAVSVVGTNGATFYITGVQLEKGSTATSFDYRPYGTELALCQRYYYKIQASSSSGSFTKYGLGFARSTTRYDILLNTPVTMRAAPSTLDLSATNTFAVYDGNSDFIPSALAFDQSNTNTISLAVTVSGATQYRAGFLQANNNNTSYIGLGAEL